MRASPRSRALVSAWLDFLPEAQRPLAAHLRGLVAAAEPALAESLKWGNLVFALEGQPLLALAPHKGCLHLQFFQGSRLPASLGPLEPGGRESRSLKLRHDQIIDRARIQALVRAAVALARPSGPRHEVQDQDQDLLAH